MTKPCNNCGSTKPNRAWNDRYCTDCESNYSKAYARAQYISRATNVLYSLDEDDVIMFKNNSWYSCVETTAHQIRNNSNFKAI